MNLKKAKMLRRIAKGLCDNTPTSYEQKSTGVIVLNRKCDRAFYRELKKLVP